MLSYMLPGEDKSASPAMHQQRITHQTTMSSNQQKNRLQLDLDSDSNAPRMTPIIRTIEMSETRYKELRHPVTGAILDSSRNEHVQEMVFSDTQALRDRLEKSMIRTTNGGKVPFEKTTILKTHANPSHNNNNHTTTFDKCYNNHYQPNGAQYVVGGYGLGGYVRQYNATPADQGRTAANGGDTSANSRYFNDSGVSTGDEDNTPGGASSVLGGASPAASSDTSTPLAQNAGKKLLMQGGHGTAGSGKPALKRVSFGSSKGSMVETLVYESPAGGALLEEPEYISNKTQDRAQDDEYGSADGEDTERSRVRVTFYQSTRPQCVSPAPSTSPDQNCDHLLLTSSMAATATRPTVVYDRQISNESGWDNPFRPDGELSREADEIVSMIKGGHPITPVSGSAPAPLGGLPAPAGGVIAGNGNAARANGNAVPGSPGSDAADGKLVKKEQTTVSSAAPGTQNGGATSPMKGGAAGASSPVAVQRGTVPQQSTPQQAELVVLKKKPKCKCCVIQ